MDRMMWLAIFLNGLALFFLSGIVILHLIHHKNGDRWDDQ